MDRAAFFAKFEEEHAVQYFYEPFLQAYDPELRKQLGVWYTPPEIIRYMVARVDTVLREELGVADGLADPDVYILDPCCGTGGFLVATLAHIAETLVANGEEGLLAAKLKQAATQRVFGFEILPAPLVIAHMQIGLALSRRGAPLAEDERAGVYLTNALTGWEPPDAQKEKALQQLLIPFPELAHERDAAREVKRHGKILVVLGNPPYNGFAGVAIGKSATCRAPIARRRPRPRRKARASTISTSASSAWPSAASWRRPAAAWSASSPTTPGWTACRSPGCASVTWTCSTGSGSIV